MMTEEKLEKQIFNDEFSLIWRDLTYMQRRFVVQMLECSSKKEAAEILGIETSTVYGWGKDGPVDRAIELLQLQSKDQAVSILSQSLAKAAMVKIAGLDAGDERVSQAAASDILDRFLGKAVQGLDVTSGGDKIEIVVKYADDDNAP